jgi:hypothetical protein
MVQGLVLDVPTLIISAAHFACSWQQCFLTFIVSLCISHHALAALLHGCPAGSGCRARRC